LPSYTCAYNGPDKRVVYEERFESKAPGTYEVDLPNAELVPGAYGQRLCVSERVSQQNVACGAFTCASSGGFLLDEAIITVDTTPPRAAIVKGAPDRTSKRMLKFKFSSDDPEASFECKIDRTRYKPCRSPRTVKRLGKGKHTFMVRAIDGSGNVGKAAIDKFRVTR
jgi:hypothetical protein